MKNVRLTALSAALIVAAGTLLTNVTTVRAADDTVILGTICVFKPDGSLYDDQSFGFDILSSTPTRNTKLIQVFQFVNGQPVVPRGCLEIGFNPNDPPTVGDLPTFFFPASNSVGSFDGAPQHFTIDVARVSPVVPGPSTWNGMPLSTPLLPRIDPPLTINLVLAPAIKTVAAKIVNAQGEGVSGAHLVMNRETSPGRHEPWAAIMTDRTGSASIPLSTIPGKFEFQVVPTESNDLMYIEADQGSPVVAKSQTIDVSGQGTESKSLAFSVVEAEPTTVVEGVIDFRANGHDERQLWFVEKKSRLWKWPTANDDGSFRVTLAPGEYDVKLSGTVLNSREVYRPSVTVRRGSTVDLGVAHSSFWDDSPIGRWEYRKKNTSGARSVAPMKIGSYAFNRTGNTTRSSKPSDMRHLETFSTSINIASSDSENYFLEYGAAYLGLGAGELTSKTVTPKGARISKVTLVDFPARPSNRSMLTYAISPNGIDWLTVEPNTETRIPPSWNTTSGLRWKISSQNTGSEAIRINAVRLYFSAMMPKTGRPVIDQIRVDPDGAYSRVTLTGQNFSRKAAVQFGDNKVVTVSRKRATTVTLRVPRSWTRDQTPVYLLNDRLQLGFRYIVTD